MMNRAYSVEDLPQNLKLVRKENMPFILGNRKKVYGEDVVKKNFALKHYDVVEHSNNERRGIDLFLTVMVLVLFMYLLVSITDGFSPGSVSKKETPILLLLCLFLPWALILFFKLLTLLFGNDYFSNHLLERAVYYDLIKKGALVIGTVKMSVPINDTGVEISYNYRTPSGNLNFDKYLVFKKMDINPGDSVAVLFLEDKVSILL